MNRKLLHSLLGSALISALVSAGVSWWTTKLQISTQQNLSICDFNKEVSFDVIDRITNLTNLTLNGIGLNFDACYEPDGKRDLKPEYPQLWRDNFGQIRLEKVNIALRIALLGKAEVADSLKEYMGN